MTGGWELFLEPQALPGCRPASARLAPIHTSAAWSSVHTELLPTLPYLPCATERRLHDQWSPHYLSAHTGRRSAGGYPGPGEAPFTLHLVTKWKAMEKLLNFTLVLFIPEPNKVSPQKGFLKCQLTLGARKQRRQKTPTCLIQLSSCNLRNLSDWTEQLAKYQACLAWWGPAARHFRTRTRKLENYAPLRQQFTKTEKAQPVTK